MDYHSLPRKQLQALCKKHEIPANLTNLQMADALAALLNVEAAKGGKKQSTTGRDDEEKPVLTEISNVPKVSTRSKKVCTAMEEETLEEQTQSTDSEGDGGAKTGKTRTRGPAKVVLKNGKGDAVVEEAVKTRRGVCREKTSVISAPEVNVEVVEQKVGNNKKKKNALVNEDVKGKVEETVEIEQGLQDDLALQNGRRNTRNPRKKAEIVKQSELNVGGAAEENTDAEATPPCKKTVRTKAGKVTHEVGSRHVAAKKSSVRVPDGDEENMTKATELRSDIGNRKPYKAGGSPIVIDLVDDSDEEEEGSKEKKGDHSVHNTLVTPAEKAAAAEHRKEGDKIMPAQRTLRGRQANASVVKSNAKLSESSKDMVTRRVQKGGKKELVVEACVEESKSIEVDESSIEATLNPSQSPKHVATRRGRRGAQKEEVVVVNACTNGKVNELDVSVEAPSHSVGASLETTSNLSLSPKQIVTRRGQKVGQKKGVAVRASVEEDKVNVVDVSVEATTDPVDASLEATANLSQSPKQVITRRSRKAGQKEEVALSACAEEDKVNVVDISAKDTSDPVEASLEATTNLTQSPEQIVTRRSRKVAPTEEVAVSASAEEKVNAVDVSVEATADPFESSEQVVTRRGRKGGQKNDENKNGAANPAQSSKQVVNCRGKKVGQKELVVNASAEEYRVGSADDSGSLKQEVTCRGRKGAQKAESVVAKNEAANVEAITANPFHSPIQVVTRRGRKGGQKHELEVNASTEEKKVNAAHVSIEATINCAELPKQVVTRRGCKGGQKVTKMVEEGKNKVVTVPVEVVTCKGQKELEVDSSVEKELEVDCNEDHEQIHGPKIETKRTCRKQGTSESEGHKKANTVKASDVKETDVKETVLTQGLQRKVRDSKPRKICGKQEGADTAYPPQEKLKVKESHRKAMSSGRTAIRRDLKDVRVGIYEEVDGGEAPVNNEAMEEVGSGETNIQKMVENEPEEMGVVGVPVCKDLKSRGKSMKKPSTRGSPSTINGADQKVVAEKECEDLAHEDKKNAHVDESGALGVILKEVKTTIVDREAAEMFESKETIIIQTVPIQCEEYEKKPVKPAEDTAALQDGIHMDERTNMEDEDEADPATSEKLVSVPMVGETIFKESAVEIEGTEIHDEEQQIIKPVAAIDTASVKDAIHMDESINMQDEGADAATSEKLGSVPMDNEANFKESAVEIEEMKVYDEEQQIIKPVAATDTAAVKDAIHMDESRNMQDEEGADAATSEKLGSVPMDNEANFKESVVEIEETKILDEEQLIIKQVAPTDECTYESQLGDPKYLEKDSEPELIEGYKPKPIEGGNYLKQCQSAIEVSSTLIQAEDRLDSSSLTQQSENVETQQFEILSNVKCSGIEEKSSIGFKKGSQVQESLENLPAKSGLGALEVDDLETHLYSADISDLNAENVEVQESEFLVHVECDIHEHTKQENPGLLIEQSFEVLQADSLFIHSQEVQDKGFPGLVDEMIKGDQFRQKSENMYISLSCTAETDEIIENKDSVAGESLTDTDVDSHDDSLSECYDPLEEELKAAHGINEEQCESDTHKECEGHGIFLDASHLKEEDKEDTYDEDESHDLDIAEETADEEKIADSIADTYDEDESHDLDIAEETADEEKIADSIADTYDEDESYDLDIAEETADEEKIADSIADTYDEDESHDLDIAEETADEEKIADSIAGNWNEGDQSELAREKQALKILPQQASYSEARDSEECTIQYISATSVKQNPISLVNDEAHEYRLSDSEIIAGYHDSVVEKEQQIEQVSKSESHDDEERMSHKNYNSDKNDGFPMLSDAVCLKVEDHQLVHASYDEAQEANENIRVSDVGLQHRNSAIKDEAHEEFFNNSYNDEEFYGLDELYGSKVDTVYSMSELMPSLSQHADELVDYKVDEIHVHTQTESNTLKNQLSCACNYKEIEPDMAEEIFDSSISFEDSNDVFISSGMDESVLEKEADMAQETVHTSINFEHSTDVFPCSGMIDSVLEIETDTASIDFEDNNNVFPHQGMDDSVLDKLPEIITKEACKQELSQLHTPMKTQEVTEGYNISPCLITLFGLDYSTASKRPELADTDVEEKIPVSNVDLQNSPLLADTDDEDESHDLDTADEEKTAVSIGGNWNEGDQFELLSENQVLEIPAQQTSDSEAQAGEECSKEYISASYNVQKNPISLVNDEGLEYGLNDSKTIEGYQDSVIEKEEQIEQFSKSETKDAQEPVSPKNYNDEAQEAMEDEAHEDKFCYSDNSKVFFGLDGLNGSTPQKEEDDIQQIYENEAYEGESMDCGSTPELKNKLKFDAENLNGTHEIESLPKTLSLVNLSQLASCSEGQEPGECSKEEISVLNNVQQSHISLVNGEAQEDKLRESKISEGFHDSVYEKEEYDELASMAKTQDAEGIISHNDVSPDIHPELVDVSLNEAQGEDENIQASEFCLQYCNSVTKDEVHQDNFFSDDRDEFYGINELYVSTPQKEEDVVEQISKNETGDVQIPLTEGDQVEYVSYSVAVEKDEVEDGTCQENISIVDGITDASPIKDQLFYMDNNGEHERFIAPDKIERKEDDQEEQSIQNEAEETQKCKVGENIQLVKVDTVAINQEPSDLDTPLKMPKLTKGQGLDISPCLNSLFGLDFSASLNNPRLMDSNDVFHCSGMDDSVQENSSVTLTKAACKQQLSQLDTPLKTPEVTEGYDISPCLSTLFGLGSSIPSKRSEPRKCYNISPCLGMNDPLLEHKDVCQRDLACNQQLSLDMPLKRLEHAEGPECHSPVKKLELTENNVMLPCLQIVFGEQDSDVTSTSFEDALQQTIVTEHLLPEVPLGDHVSLMEKDARVLEGTVQSESILTENPVESGEVAEESTILADMNGPSKGDSKSTKLIDRLQTLSNRLQTLHLDLQGQLPESFYATPSRKQMNSKGTRSTEKTRDPISVYRPRQSIESDEAMHSSMKKLRNLHKENETAAKDSEKVISKQPALQNLSSNALEQRLESLDTPLKMLGHTEGHDISPCLYTLFGPECNTPLKNHELPENNDLQILLGEQYRDVTGTSFEDALQQPLVTEPGSPGVSLGYAVSLMDKDVRVFEETEQSKLMQLDMQGQLPELCYVTPSRKPMNSKSIGSEKKTRDPMSVYRPKESLESDKALHSSMKENHTGLEQLSLRKLRNLCKENETKATTSEKNLSSNALEQRVEYLDTPLKTLEYTEGHDISPCLYTLFGPEYNTPLKKPELTENNDTSPYLQILFGEQYRDVSGTSFEDALQQPLVTEPGPPEVSLGYNVSLMDKDVGVFERTEQSKCMQLDLQEQLPVQQPLVTGPEPPEVQLGYHGSLMDNNVWVFEGTEQSKCMQLDLQGQLPELCYVTPSRKMNSKGIGSTKKTRDPMSVNRPRPSIESDKAMHSSMKENPTDLAQLSLRQLRNLYKEKETKTKDSEKVVSKRPALQNLSSNALEQRVESVGYSPRPFPSERRLRILEEDCS